MTLKKLIMLLSGACPLNEEDINFILLYLDKESIKFNIDFVIGIFKTIDLIFIKKIC